MIEITDAHNSARLAGTQAFIDTGTGVAAIAFYSVPRQTIADLPSAPAVTAIPLDNPCGVIDATGLHLASTTDGLNASTGLILWARLFNRNGDVVADFDVREVADPPNMGEIAISNTTVYAGGVTRLVSATLT